MWQTKKQLCAEADVKETASSPWLMAPSCLPLKTSNDMCILHMNRRSVQDYTCALLFYHCSREEILNNINVRNINIKLLYSLMDQLFLAYWFYKVFHTFNNTLLLSISTLLYSILSISLILSQTGYMFGRIFCGGKLKNFVWANLN